MSTTKCFVRTIDALQSMRAEEIMDTFLILREYITDAAGYIWNTFSDCACTKNLDGMRCKLEELDYPRRPDGGRDG